MSDSLQPLDVELRRAARERALELLYEAEVKALGTEDLLAGLAISPPELAVELVRGVDSRRGEIDQLLERRVAPRWSLDRLAAVDRAVLRLATYELLASPRPEAVVLNEAVVLARRFGTDDSPRFVNGVLSAVAAEARPRPAGQGPETEPPEGHYEPTAVPEVDAVVMDLDGVIRHWDEAALADGEESLGLPGGTIAGVAFEPARLELAMRGRLSAEEWFEEVGATVAGRYPVEADDVAEILAHVGWRIDETVMELVDQVRRQVPVVLLSNASSRLEDDLRLSRIHDRFDAVVGSAALGVVKPEHAAFAAAAQAAGAPLERCLLVDDRDENVTAAQDAGMRGVRFTAVEPLVDELVALGLLPTAP